MRQDGTVRRSWVAAGAAILLFGLRLPAWPAEKSSSTTIAHPNVGAARASYEINKNAGQTTFLDREISGLGLAPNAYSLTKVQRGMGLDLYYTLVAGSLFGSRRGIGNEFADPVLSQIAAIQGKWVFFREGPFWPAFAAGLDLSLDLNFRGGLPFSKFDHFTYPSYLAISKTIYPRTGTFLTIGRYAKSEMTHLAYLTRFLDPRSSGVIYTGLDFKVKDPSKGFRVECYMPQDQIDDAKIYNFYIKALSAMPMTLITYARSEAGRAVVLSFSFRVALFPSPTHEDKYKKRWWNPLSWYLDDNRNYATRLALAADALLKAGDYKKARQKYQESLFLNDRNPSVHFNMAMASMQIGGSEDLARAVFHFKRSIELAGPDADKLYALGVAYFKAGQKDYARTVWSDSLKFEPDNAKAKQGLKLLENPKG